jgi:hypothetical protein
VVRGSDLEEGESQGLPVWSRHVGDPILASNLTRRLRRSPMKTWCTRRRPSLAVRRNRLFPTRRPHNRYRNRIRKPISRTPQCSLCDQGRGPELGI